MWFVDNSVFYPWIFSVFCFRNPSLQKAKTTFCAYVTVSKHFIIPKHYNNILFCCNNNTDRSRVEICWILQFFSPLHFYLDILKKLSKSQNTVFCGRIQLFLARLFPLTEKSGEPHILLTEMFHVFWQYFSHQYIFIECKEACN